MYVTNEEWEQNNQDYLKESYEENVVNPPNNPTNKKALRLGEKSKE